MSALDQLLTSFRPEDRRRGEELLHKQAVSISVSSDTNVSAFVKDSPACKVSLLALDITSPSFSGSGSCASSRKGKLCKHIWAVLLKLDEQRADFLAERREIEASGQNSPQKNEFTTRQAEYRKQQYQRQKEYVKKRKAEEQAADQAPRYPAEIETVLSYFKLNGISLSHPLDLRELTQAKKTLSQVLHPDKGGSHDEIVELNRNYELIFNYLHS